MSAVLNSALRRFLSTTAQRAAHGSAQLGPSAVSGQGEGL